MDPKRIAFFALVLTAFVSGCKKEFSQPHQRSVEFNQPTGFPPIPVPENNPLTAEKIALGKLLFQDEVLSKNRDLSCASCHQRHLAFADDRSVSPGDNDSLGFRNTMGLANVAYNTSFFWDGGVPTLEQQVFVPFDAEFEFNLPITKAVERLNQGRFYREQFKKAFDTLPSVRGITHSIASYVRTLVSGNSRFDRYYYHHEENALTTLEKKGWKLFNSEKTKCRNCHSGFNFTDQRFYHVGLEVNEDDPGRRRITIEESDVGKFKVPTLRNVELTAPYMHDGRFSSLEEVVDHFASGGTDHPNKAPEITGFELSTDEKHALIAFLKTLTDSSFVN